MADRPDKPKDDPLAIGMWPFVLRYGVVLWGLTTAILFQVVMMLFGRYPEPHDWIITLIVFPIGGIFWGLLLWFLIKSKRR